MNYLGIALTALVVLVLAILGVTLAIAISGNVKVGKRIREGLSDKLKQLPFSRMLRRTHIDIPSYLNETPVTDIEQHLRKCERCARLAECEAALSAEETSEIDYSFCPNQRALEKLQKAVTAARKDS